MATSQQSKFIGDCCIVVDTDGNSKIHRLEDGKSVFEKAKTFIGCKWLDHVIVQVIVPGVKLEFLVNDNGYADWGNDPSKVNQIATAIYNRSPIDNTHYILGNIVMCLGVDGVEGGEFTGMSEALAANIAMANNNKYAKQAMDAYPKPDKLNDPVVTVSSYESTEDLLRAMKGDKTVKPIDKTVIGGDAEV